MNFVSCARERENCADGRRMTEYSFYTWRKRVSKQGPCGSLWRTGVRGGRRVRRRRRWKLVLATGERLRISAGVDAATLRTVLDVLRA